jgi:hypothetical protein
MKKILLISALFVTPAFAQQPAAQPSEYQLKVTPAEVDLLSEGLQTQPFGKVFPLINKLRAQQPKPETKPVDKPAEKKE